MLPLLRLLLVGGVCIAFLALLLGLSVPGATLSRALYDPEVRGFMVRSDARPDLRHMLIVAATRRAEEIGRVNTLSGAPKGWQPPMTRFAGLPADRSDTDPEDTTGTVQSPGATMPVEIGETSSTELPVKPEEPPAKKPGRAKPAQEGKRPAPRHRAPAKPAENTSFDIFGITRPRGLNDATANQASAGYDPFPQNPQQTGRRAANGGANQFDPSGANRAVTGPEGIGVH